MVSAVPQAIVNASPAVTCVAHLMAPVSRSSATTASVIGAAGCEYASPVATYSDLVAASIVGADHTAAPEGPHNCAPFAFFVRGVGASVIM